MKLPYIVTVWAETHSRATYLITNPRIIHFKQHLSFFLLPLSFSLCFQQNGINKPICMQIINHYLDPLPVYVDKDYNLPSLCIILLGCLWFGFPCVQPDVVHVTRPNCSLCFCVLMHEWLPAGISVVVCGDAVTQRTNKPKDQQTNQLTALLIS